MRRRRVALSVRAPSPPRRRRRRRTRRPTAKYFASIRHQPVAAARIPHRDAEGRRSAQPSVGRRSTPRATCAGPRTDGLCLATATMSIVTGPCDAGAGRPPVADVVRQQRPALQPGDRRDVDAALGSRAERPRSFLRHVRQVRAVVAQDRRHARGGRGARRGGARQLSRADADAGRRRRRRCAGPRPGGIRIFRRCATTLLADGFRDARSSRLRNGSARRGRGAAARAAAAAARATPDAGCRVTIRYISQVGTRGRAGGGLRADARRLRNRRRRSPRRRHQPRAARRRSGCRARFLAADVDARLPPRRSIRA